jgi:ABC-type branched-subunit amino acid transport system substrate-binding protein
MNKIIIAVFLFFLFSCASDIISPLPNDTAGITETEIKIGISAAFSGPAMFLGTELNKGAMLYIDATNTNGGIEGRKITCVVYDDGYDPKRALENTIRLIENDKTFMLFNYVGTPTARMIVRKINDAKIPVFGLFTGAEFLRSPFQPFIFNVRASYFDEVQVIVDKWIAEGKTRISLFKQNDAFGKAVEDGAELALARHNLEVLAVSTYERGKLPTDAAVQTIAASRPEGVIMVGTNFALATFVDMATKVGIEADFYTVSFVGSEAFAKDLQNMRVPDAVNIYVTQVVPPLGNASNKLVQEFSDAFQTKYPKEQINYVAFEGYVNAKILIEALRRCGKALSRSKLMHILERMSDYDPGMGIHSQISSQHHSFYEEVFVTQYRNGRFD